MEADQFELAGKIIECTVFSEHDLDRNQRLQVVSDAEHVARSWIEKQKETTDVVEEHLKSLDVLPKGVDLLPEIIKPFSLWLFPEFEPRQFSVVAKCTPHLDDSLYIEIMGDIPWGKSTVEISSLN
jgi:hypothetical protein